MLTASEYKDAVYHGDVAFIEEDVWLMIEFWARERDGVEVKKLLNLLYDSYQ